MPPYAYKKRAFLLPHEPLDNSYIFAVVDSSGNGLHHFGNNMLTLATCHRMVEIEFSLHSANQRRESLAMADTIAKTVNEFRDALRIEADLIKNYKGDRVATEGKDNKSKNNQRRGGRR